MAAAAAARTTLVHRDVWLPRLWLCGGGVLAEQLRCQGLGVSEVLWRSLVAATTWWRLWRRDSATVAATWRRCGWRLRQLGSGKMTAPGMGGRRH